MSRTFVFHSPADLQFRKMDGTEALSDIARFDILLSSSSPDIDPTDLLGASVTVEVQNQFDSPRFLNGLVSNFTFIGPDGSAAKSYLYKAHVQSWLFIADRKSDCRIYQEKSVPDIIKAALADFGMPFELKLKGSYAPILYSVQFNETVLNYVKRMAELVGIFWYIRHAMGTHTIVFTDGIPPTLDDYSTIPFLTPGSRVLESEEQISEWHVENEVKSGRFSTTSYNFEAPRANLLVDQIVRKDHAHDSLEMFEWTGTYTERGQGADLVEVRREQQQLQFETITAKSNVRGIAPGYKFTLDQHPREVCNGEYLIVTAVYHFEENAESGRSDGAETTWSTDFTVRSTKYRYYPPRVTHKPIPAGPHTALVTGPAGEELWTNAYGQVKVYFYWDRHSPKNETSSCWIRVSSIWAGTQFGGMHVPRIGQEVIVEYVNGNIDMPIITGRVFNFNNMPPWDLPANATQSGILSRSSKGGEYTTANAIRFEDKKGAEQVWIQAERNMDTVVEHDETHHVMHDRTKTIDHDETVFVHHDRTETVDNNETITVHNNRQERVDQNESISIGGNRTEDVGKDESVTISGNRTNHISKNHSETIGKNLTETVMMASVQNVGLAKMTNVGGAYSINVALAMNTLVGMSQTEQVVMNKSVDVGKKFTITAGDELDITVGKSRLVMKSDGTISLTGTQINIEASGPMQLSGKDVDIN
jgi:type VI secretion system secreted protein VgrG